MNLREHPVSSLCINSGKSRPHCPRTCSVFLLCPILKHFENLHEFLAVESVRDGELRNTFSTVFLGVLTKCTLCYQGGMRSAWDAIFCGTHCAAVMKIRRSYVRPHLLPDWKQNYVVRQKWWSFYRACLQKRPIPCLVQDVPFSSRYDFLACYFTVKWRLF